MDWKNLIWWMICQSLKCKAPSSKLLRTYSTYDLYVIINYTISTMGSKINISTDKILVWATDKSRKIFILRGYSRESSWSKLSVMILAHTVKVKLLVEIQYGVILVIVSDDPRIAPLRQQCLSMFECWIDIQIDCNLEVGDLRWVGGHGQNTKGRWSPVL